MDMQFTALPDPETDPQFYRDVPMKRLIAWVADTILISLASLLVVAATLFLTLFMFPAIFVAVHFAYRSFFLARNSATPGMQIMAIEIRGGRGHRLDTVEAVLHTLVYSVIAAFVLPQLISIVLMATTSRGQGLHDMALGTTAINRPADRY
ncbi:hypothetical protein DDZ14_06660 [Maritimibacter sp. 55A14]|uniref:RDD family protein n=1 Tax=Maritimibacter sp. 55A14 TaxID=2174844 RepID=UPI000D6099CA|nr:RDD family protein [Maritimibacter sp. 55A14]PWE33094.1 hypothetical protein DDZ14_06660 [Maritimibacter sp. 55A14]